MTRFRMKNHSMTHPLDLLLPLPDKFYFQTSTISEGFISALYEWIIILSFAPFRPLQPSFSRLTLIWVNWETIWQVVHRRPVRYFQLKLTLQTETLENRLKSKSGLHRSRCVNFDFFSRGVTVWHLTLLGYYKVRASNFRCQRCWEYMTVWRCKPGCKRWCRYVVDLDWAPSTSEIKELQIRVSAVAT